MKKTVIILFLIKIALDLSGQVGFDNRNWLVGRYYGTHTQITPAYGQTITCLGGLDITKLLSDTSHLFMQDSSCMQTYWQGTNGYSTVLTVANDSSLKYNNIFFGKLFFNDSIHFDYYTGGLVPYITSFRMKKVKSYLIIYGNPQSLIPCNNAFSTVSFTVSPTVPKPITCRVDPPSSCGSFYFLSSTNVNSTFTLGCAGTHTLTLRDANNLLLGIYTHTVIIDSVIYPFISASSSAICSGETATLTVSPNGPGYTIDAINWSEGSTTYSIVVSPTITSAYSISGLYTNTAAGSKTCTARNTETITVNSCIGIEELEALQNIVISPNPAGNKLCLQNTTGIEIKKLGLLTIEGKEIPLPEKEKNEIAVSALAEGIYFLWVETDKGILTRKIIIQR